MLEPLMRFRLKLSILFAATMIAFFCAYTYCRDRPLLPGDAISLLNNCPVFTGGEYVGDANGNLIQGVRSAEKVSVIGKDHSSVRGFYYCGANWRYQNIFRTSGRVYISNVTFFHDDHDGSWRIYAFTDENKRSIEIEGRCRHAGRRVNR